MQYFGGSVMAVAQDQMQRVVHDATIGMARGAQVLGFRVGCCCPAVMFSTYTTRRCRRQRLLPFADISSMSICDGLPLTHDAAATSCLHVRAVLPQQRPNMRCCGNDSLCWHCRIQSCWRSCSWRPSRRAPRGGQSTPATPKVCSPAVLRGLAQLPRQEAVPK
jgi:hypothetical protein